MKYTRKDGKPRKRQPNKDGKKPTTRAIVEDPGDGTPAQGNQWTATKRQQLWLKYYMDPKEHETWGNSYQAALKAGYSPSYAEDITNLDLEWVKAAKNIMRLNPEHLKVALAEIINGKYSKDSDRIQAIKLLGMDQGMFVQKQLVGTFNVEDALNELKD